VVDLLPEANARIKAFFNDICRHFDNGDVQLDAGILTHKPRKDRFDEKGPDGWLHDKAQQSSRIQSIIGKFIGSRFQCEKRRLHARQQACARLSK
jgi:hypothetical protein